MDVDSKWTIFAKILEGKVDFYFLEDFNPAYDWIDLSLIEATVVEGVLDDEALSVIRRGANLRYFKQEKTFLENRLNENKAIKKGRTDL